MMKTKNSISRRKAIYCMGAGLAAAIVSPMLTAQGSPKNDMPDPLQDPVSKYPKPPFKGQLQPCPGLTCKMDLRPDHGESSCKGSGRLKMRKTSITGGDPGMGRAAAIAYAREGADVAINYLPSEEPDAKEVIAFIKAEGRKAVAIPGDLRDESFCKKMVADAVSALSGLDILVNNAGRQQSNLSIQDITTEQFIWR